jgi:hypothetical protein
MTTEARRLAARKTWAKHSVPWNAAKRAKYQEWRLRLAEMKVGRGCIDCGYNRDSLLLEWDHVWGDKIRGVTQVEKFGSWDKLMEEVAKCDVRCTLCHRAKTWKSTPRIRKQSVYEALCGAA